MAEDEVQADQPAASPSVLSPSGYSNHAIHMVRTVQQINVALSQMADTKASILMGATFLVFTICVGQAQDGAFPAPLVVLAVFAFISAMCAVFAVLPSVGSDAPGDGDAVGTNRLFFGHFADMDEDAWTRTILADLRADEAVFRLMLHDIYQNGQVLQRKKYRFLGYAYRSFMLGLCLTVAIFAAELALAWR
ncbi:MAG: Pycsar system effector family protein [Erythrobacter sp.]